MKIDGLLVDVDYSSRGDSPAVGLCIRTKEGVVAVQDKAFNAYFYVIPKGSAANFKEKVERAQIEGISRVEVVEKSYEDQRSDVLKVVVGHPKYVLPVKHAISELSGFLDAREHHLSLGMRYLLDHQLVPMSGISVDVDDDFVVKGNPKTTTFDCQLNYCSFDMEVLNPAGEPRPSKDAIIMISLAFWDGTRKVLTHRSAKKMPDFVEVLEDEKAMLRRFVALVREKKVDVLFTYNGDMFDFPYLRERANNLGVKLALGIDNAGPKLRRMGMKHAAEIAGIMHVDLYPIVRREINLDRYTLDKVYKHYFGKEKIDIECYTMQEYWDDEAKLRILMDYSMSDADVTLEIGLKLVAAQIEMSKIICRPLFDTTRMASGQKVEKLLMKEAVRQGILIPKDVSDEEVRRRSEVTYEGALVVSPKKGMVENIAVLDFKSMYPSIIVSHNIDPYTIDCGCCKEAHVSPEGVKFCKEKKGFIPEVLKGILEERAKVKENMKGMRKDSVDYRVSGAAQYALKTLANSFYGYFGFARSRWYSLKCASSITAWGRYYIKESIKIAGNNNFDVLYSDTDSIFLKKDTVDIKLAVSELIMIINKEMPGIMKLELQDIYKRGIFITKKRYALYDFDGNLTVKGLEFVRRDWAEIAKSTQETVLKCVLQDGNATRAVSEVKKIIAKVRGGKVTKDDLVIYSQLTKDVKDYDQTSPHVAAAEKALKRGMAIRAGVMVPFIITKKGKSISDRAQMVDFVEEGDYDAQYYIAHQIVPAAMRVLEAFDVNPDELETGKLQSNLSSFM